MPIEANETRRIVRYCRLHQIVPYPHMSFHLRKIHGYTGSGNSLLYCNRRRLDRSHDALLHIHLRLKILLIAVFIVKKITPVIKDNFFGTVIFIILQNSPIHNHNILSNCFGIIIEPDGTYSCLLELRTVNTFQ